MKDWIKKAKIISKLESGFTLIEMSLVLFVISVLLILFIPNLSGRQETAAKTGNEAMETVILNQIDLYKMDNNNDYPTSLTELKSNNYLTEKQLERANELFTYSDGKLTSK